MMECLHDKEVLKFTGSPDDFNEDAVAEWYRTHNSYFHGLCRLRYSLGVTFRIFL